MCNNLTPSQKEELIKILKAPIIVDKDEDGFRWSDDSKTTIISGQKYISEKSKNVSPDADMSNIAVAFYESLYKKTILNKEDGHLIDENFAGDTMNTPKFVGRSCVNDKPEELNKLIDKYHCLANFWILPQKVGRYKNENCKPFCKVNYKDYMDKFLNAIMNDKKDRCNDKCDKTKCPSYKKGEFNHCYPKYCTLFNPDKKEEIIWWSTFASVHCIDNVYMHNNNGSYEEVPFSNQDNLDIIKSMNKLIDKRAEAILESDQAYRLYLKLTEQLNEKSA